ncbi:MAG TPA: DUF4303 domain-containing protein [Humisphaera sp.]
MAIRPARKPDARRLRSAYETDLAAAWAAARRAHAAETPYAFVLWGLEGGEPPRFTPVVLTEESLTRVAQQYVDRGHYDALDEARKALRYSTADSPHAGDLEEATPTVDAVVEPFARMLDDKTGYALLAKAAIAALQALDAKGLFGTGAERERVLLVVVTDGTPVDWSKPSAKLLNPPAVYQRFEDATRIEGTFACCDGLAVPSDGRSLYAAGSHHLKPAGAGGGDGVGHLVAYDVDGRRLARRWAFECPPGGDAVRAVGCSADGRAVVALRSRYANGGGRATLVRLGRDSNVPTAEHALLGEPAGLAVAADGSRVAVSLHDKTLHLFDGDFRPVRSWAFPKKAYRPLVLRSGDVLVPTEDAVLRLDPARDEPPAVAAPLRSFQLATDAAESLLAVGRWVALAGPERDRPVEFGVHLLRLPTFEPVRTVLVPGHMVMKPALSPDGRLLAVEAQQIGTPRRFVVVVDTETGTEVARRKVQMANVLRFLPDSRTLAIGVSAHTTGEPIVLWTVTGT